MKKKFTNFLLVSLILTCIVLLTSCNVILEKYFNNKFITPYSVNKIDKKIVEKIPGSDYYGYINGIDYFKFMNKNKVEIEFPTFLLFDKNNRLCSMYCNDTISCPNKKIDNFGELDANTQILYSENDSLQKKIISMINYIGTSFNPDITNYDYVIYSFNILNIASLRQKSVNLVNSVHSNKNYKILTVYVNCNCLKED